MDNIQYHTIAPQNNQDEYSEFSTLNFELLTGGRKLNPNSVRLDFELEVFKTGTTRLAAADRVYLDNMVAGHSFIESIQVNSQGLSGAGGMLENIQEYPRWVNMLNRTTLAMDDLIDASHLCEGKVTIKDATSAVLQQVNVRTNAGDAAALLVDRSFSLKPMCCLNRMMGAYSFDRNGFLQVSFNLARNLSALHGQGTAADTSYKLKNVSLRYTTRPEDGVANKVTMNSVVNVKATANSSQYNLDARVASKACSGVVVSFLEQSKESYRGANSYALEQYPLLDEINYRFNDSVQYVTYAVKDRGDMVRKGIEAINTMNNHSAKPRNLKANTGYIIGLGFDTIVDLSKEKFSVELISSSNNLSLQPRNVYLYFLTIVAV